MRSGRLGWLLALTLVLAGCDGSATSAPATVASTTTANGSSGTTAVVGSGKCQASNLAAEIADAGDGAAAIRDLIIQVTNTSASRCSTGGYFGVSSYGIGGQPITTEDDRVAESPAPQFTLGPRGSLTFTIGIGDLPSGPQGTCPRVATFRLAVPNDAGTLEVVLLDAAGKGTQVVECSGDIRVTAAAPA